MVNPLVSKLEHFTTLSSADRESLDRVAEERVRRYEARVDVIREGDNPHVVRLIVSGWAYRYKQLADGRRQIVALFLPGDLCDHTIFILREMDHSISTLTPVTLAEITRESFERVLDDHPRIVQALWWESLVNAATQREWTLNLGQRDALERIAHLLCEVFHRLRMVGKTDETSCEFPFTQAELADVTGMTSVHVNRTLQELRAKDLIVLRSRRLTILDLEALQAVALFTPNYLHLDRIGRHLDAIAAERPHE